MSWGIYFLIFLLLCLLIWHSSGFFVLSSVSKKWLLIAFGLKVIAGAAVVLLYTHYYTDKQNSDIYKYFDDGMFLHSLATTQPALFLKLMLEWNIETPEVLTAIKKFNHWDPKVRSALYNDSRIIIKLNALLAFFSRGNIFIHSLVASFMGFAGLIAMAKAVEKFESEAKHYGFLLLFFPSVIIWSSAMLKETVLMMVLGFFLLAISTIKEDFGKPVYWLGLMLMLLLLAIFKVYVLLSLIVAASFYLISKNFSSKHLVSVFGLMFFIGVIAAGFLADRFFLQHTFLQNLAQKQSDSIKLAHYMNAGSIVYIPTVDADSPITFLRAMPRALWNVLFEPMLWKASGWLQLLLSAENLLLAALMIVFAFNISRLTLGQWRLSLAIVIFCLMLFLIIGITTPVLGSIVRYRVPGVALLLLPCSMVWDEFFERGKAHY